MPVFKHKKYNLYLYVMININLNYFLQDGLNLFHFYQNLENILLILLQ